MKNIQVTFTNDEQDVIGTIDFKEEIAIFVDISFVEDLCQQLREKVNIFGDPLHFRIECMSEDV